MKLRGLFLASHVGRRIFWTLLAAAAVPLLLFGFATYRAFDDHLQVQGRRQQVQAAKYVGLSLLDKLLAARAVLATAVADGDAAASSALRGDRRGRVLNGVAAVGAEAQYLSGQRALWQRWLPALMRADLQLGTGGDARLLLGHHDVLGREPSVPVAIALRDGVGRWWLAEVDAGFLFGDIHVAGVDICVRDAQGRGLACPPPADAPVSDDASWRLFLRADFAADDWVLTQVSAPGHSLAARSVVRTALLGGVAAILIVALLSLSQVRRTMVPLERLIAGTRRLARGEFRARVQHDHADEFGELAQSFNHMAERIGHQVETMQVQSAIDREILNGLDVARILRHVAQRLATLSGGPLACVVEFDRAMPAMARLHAGEGGVSVVGVPGDDTLRTIPASDPLVALDDAPGWLARRWAAPAGTLAARAVHVDGDVVALLLLPLTRESIAGADLRRELTELGDRVAVALASAARERLLLERATRDNLTGLANRLGLFEHLQRSLAEGGAAAPFSLLFIDLDRFKDVNDAFGHQSGDELLRALGERLSACAGKETVLARPGGDEFVFVVPGPRSGAQALADLALQQLAVPVPLHGRLVSVACSIGIAHHPDDGTSVADLMRRADMAMYAAKQAGGNRSAWFEHGMDARVVERAALMSDLRQALVRGEFELHYQPRVGRDRGDVRCAEALLRWRRGGGELVAPARFVDLLEESGLIDTVGMWVVETACRQLVAWRAEGIALDSVAVNVSTRQLHAPGFAQQVLSTVRRCGLEPSALELEITESIFIGHSADAIARLCTLRDAGLGIALDDFGTGYSSLSYLHTLPITCLKVDRSFVAGLGERANALALTKTIMALAGALGLQVVAEGVETAQQADLLRQLGCHKLQGFLFSRPLPAEAFAAFCAECLPS